MPPPRPPLLRPSFQKYTQSPAPKLLREIQIQQGCCTARAKLPVSLAHIPDLRGHFPRRPVLPAVYMLNSFFELTDAMQPTGFVPSSVESAQFRKVVRPCDGILKIFVERTEDGFRGVASIRRGNVDDVAAEAVFKGE